MQPDSLEHLYPELKGSSAPAATRSPTEAGGQ